MDPDEVKRLCREWEMHPRVAEILLRRGLKTNSEIKSFLQPSLNNLRDPYELRMMQEAVDLLQEAIVKNWRIVKTATTKAQRKLFFKLRSSKKTLEWFSDKDADKVATDLGVTRKDVLEMESRLYGKDVPVDISSDDDQENTTFPILISHEADPETALIQADYAQTELQRMKNAMATLDDRSRDILQKRWLTEDKVGLKALSEQHGVSMERIRQVEKQAMNKLKNQLQA